MRWFHVEPQPSGFRFLHDEISGGVEAYSKLKCQALYAGNCVRIPQAGAGYGFVDNICDFASIDANVMSNTTVSWINQLNEEGPLNNPVSTAYNKAANNWPYAQTVINNAPSNIYKDFSNALTFYIVVNMHTTRTNRAQLYMANNPTFLAQWRFIEQQSSGKIRCRLLGGGGDVLIETTLAYTSLKNYLFCLTYSGSLTAAGLTVYIDDMSTPAGTSIINNTAMTAGANGVSQRTWGATQARSDEIHLFDSVHDDSTRQNVKQIFEQYYTFT